MSDERNGADAAFNPAHDATTPTTRGCERAEDFVTHLYGEATPEQSKSFRLHLEACAVCREELSALGGVREGLGVWRAEALGSVPPLDISRAFAAPGVAARPQGRERSAAAAFAALREVFSLSPLWMRAGALAATLAVCALAALTLARAEVTWGADGLAFRAVAPERVITERVITQPAPAPAVQTSPAENLYTEEQLKAAVAREVAAATERVKHEQRRPEKIVNVADRGVKTHTQPAAPNTRRRRRAAGRDDSLLAVDDNIPRLSDLLDGSYED